jgi:hypothetical protein
MFRAAWMEMIMSKTNETSKLATFEHHNTLADSELAAVAGGVKAKAMDSPAAAVAQALVKMLIP